MSYRKKCWMCGGDGRIGTPEHPCGNCGGKGETEISEEEARRLVLEDELSKRGISK